MKAGIEWAETIPGVDGAPRPPGSSLREILISAFYDRKRVAAVFLLGLALTVVGSFLAPKQYTAEASLLMRLGREYIYVPETGDTSTGGAPVAYDREQTLQAETKILSSRDLKEDVLAKLGLAAVYPAMAAGDKDPARSHAAAVLAMDKALNADLAKGTNLMQISFVHRDPVIAARVLSQLIESYLQRRSVIFASANAATAEADFNLRQNELKVAEARLAAAKSNRKIRAFSEEQTLLLSQRNALEMQQAGMSVALAQSGGRSSSLRSSLQGAIGDVQLSSETQRSDALESARKTLLDLRLKERDLGSRYLDDAPPVVDVRADIVRTEAFIRDLEANPTRVVRTGRSPARDVVETELVRTLADQQQARSGDAAVARQRAAVEERLNEFAASERQLPALERARRMAEANYEVAAKRLRDETALAELDKQRRSNVSVVQSPMVPLQAKSLQPLILVVGTLLSLFAALLTAFLSALWRDTFLSPEEVERAFHAPLLAVIPMARA